MERRYFLLPSFSSNFILYEQGLNLNYSKEVKTHSFKNLNSFLLSKCIPMHILRFKGFIQTFYLPLIDFYLKYPHYDYYWQLEDDLVFNGDFSLFFNTSLSWNHDFIGCYGKFNNLICSHTAEHSIHNYKVSRPVAEGFIGMQRWSSKFLQHMALLFSHNTLGHVESFPLTVAHLDNFKVGFLNELTEMYDPLYCNYNTQFQEKDFSLLPTNRLIHSFKLDKFDKLFIHGGR